MINGVKHYYPKDGDPVTGITMILPGAVAESWEIRCIETKKVEVGVDHMILVDRPARYSVTGSVSGRQADAFPDVQYTNNMVSFTVREEYATNVDAVYTFLIEIHTGYRLKGSSTDALRQSGSWQLPRGRYDVRMRIKARSGNDASKDINTVYWTLLSHIVYEDFCRPGKVLIGLEIPANDQVSGSRPTVTWIQERRNVWYWDPNAGKYLQTDATNPAVACYDILHQCRQLKNIHTGQMEYLARGAPAEQMDYQAFRDWAWDCAAKGLTFNMYFDTAAGLWEALKYAEEVGRGKCLMRGTMFSCINDRKKEPVQMFTMGNIIQGSFKQEFLALKDRANAVEISFINKDKNYEKDTIIVYGAKWNESDVVENPSQIDLPGINNYAQSCREGRYRLRLVEYLKRTISFEADIDSIACMVGDCISVSHDLSKWGESGRILNITGDHIQIDRAVRMETGKNYVCVIWHMEDYKVQYSVANTGNKTDVLILEGATIFPSQYTQYVFGEINKHAKKFTVLSITRGNELRRKIQAIEYYDEVYLDNGATPVLYNGTLTVQDIADPPSVTTPTDPVMPPKSTTSAVPAASTGATGSVTTSSDPLVSTPPAITGVELFTNEDDEIFIRHNATTIYDFRDYQVYTEEVIT